MSKVSCEVIKDLMPNCIDGIASEESSALVEEHIAECLECRATWESMRGSVSETPGNEKEPGEKEIDYLKKNKKRNRLIAILSVCGAVFILLTAAFLRFFVIGGYADEDSLNCRVKVAGDKVVVAGVVNTNSGKRVSGIDFKEKDGTVTIRIRTVLTSVFGSRDFNREYSASGKIEKVVFNNSVLWTPDPAQSRFSSAMREDVIAAWDSWNEKTQLEQMTSSTFPGYISRFFTEWGDSVKYLGFEPVNPFEDAEWVEKKNFVGTDKKDDITGEFYHTWLHFYGSENGDINYLNLTAGYTMDVGKYYLSSYTQDGVSLEVVVGYPAEGEAGFSFAVPNGAVFPGPDDVSQLVYFYVIGPDNEKMGSNLLTSSVRLTFTAEPLARWSEEFSAGDRRHTDHGILFFSSFEDTNTGKISHIYYDYKDVHYTVTLYGLLDESEAEAMTNHVISFIGKKLEGDK